MNPPRSPRSAPSRPRTAPLAVLFLVAFVGSASAADRALSPSPSRLIPARGLTIYVEYDGIGGAHADAWKATAAHDVLNRTKAGDALSSVARQVVERLLKEVPDAKIAVADLADLLDHLARHGFALAIYNERDGSSSAAIVLNGFGRKDARDRSALVVRHLSIGNDGGEPPKPTRIRGRELYQIKPAAVPKPVPPPPEIPAVPPAVPADPALAPSDKAEGGRPRLLTWWFEGDDLIITDGLILGDPAVQEAPKGPRKDKGAAPGRGDRVAALLDAIEGKAPNASTHPGLEAALAEGKDLKGFEPNGLFFVEVSEAVRLFNDSAGKADGPGKDDGLIVELKLLGVDTFKRVVGRWGFQGKALLTDVRFEIPAPRAGFLGALFDQPALPVDRPLPIPSDAKALALGSFEPGKSYDSFVASFVALARTLGAPDSAGKVDEMLKHAEEAVRDATGQRLREDLLSHLGPTWCLYTTPWHVDETEMTAAALLIGVDDPGAFAKVLDALAERVNASLIGPKAEGGDKDKAGGEPPAVVLERLPAPERGYRLVSPEGVVPWLTEEIRPTVLLGKSYLVVALNPALARAAVAAESGPENRWRPGPVLAETLAMLPSRTTSLSVGDPRDSAWPEALASLPRTVQYLGNLLGAGGAAEVGGPGFPPLLGVPAPGGFRIKLDPALAPRASQVRALLFPSVLATSVDDRGLRFIGAEALPFACVGSPPGGKTGVKPGFDIDLKTLLNRVRH